MLANSLLQVGLMILPWFIMYGTRRLVGRPGEHARTLQAGLALGWISILCAPSWAISSGMADQLAGESVTGGLMVIYLATTGAVVMAIIGSYELDRTVRSSTWSLGRYARYQVAALLPSLLPGALLLITLAAIADAQVVLPEGAGSYLVPLSLAVLSLFLTGTLYPFLLKAIWGGRKLGDGALSQSIQVLAARAGVAVTGIIVVPSRGGRVPNAMVSGTGPFRHVFLTEDLLAELEPQQLQAIVAHELGHIRHRHLPKFLWLAVACLPIWGVAFIGLAAVFPPSPLAYALCGGLVGTMNAVLYTAVSRRFEHQADRFAAQLTSEPLVLASALVRLQELSGVQERPATWFERTFSTHPPFSERITCLRTMAGYPSAAPSH